MRPFEISFYLLIISVHSWICVLTVDTVALRTDLDGTVEKFSLIMICLIGSRASLTSWKLVNKLKLLMPQFWDVYFQNIFFIYSVRWGERGIAENRYPLSGKNMSFRLVWKKKKLCSEFRGALMYVTILAKGEMCFWRKMLFVILEWLWIVLIPAREIMRHWLLFCLRVSQLLFLLIYSKRT